MPLPFLQPSSHTQGSAATETENDAVTVGFVVLSPFTIVCPLIFRDYTVDKISLLYPGDQVSYVCQAQNDFGQNEKDYNLSVGGIVNSFSLLYWFYFVCVCVCVCVRVRVRACVVRVCPGEGMYTHNL